MVNTYFFTFFIIIVLICSGCAGTIHSTYDTSYSKNVEKLFILANLPEEGWSKTKHKQTKVETNQVNFQKFKLKMEKMFNKINVHCFCRVINELDLDDSEYLNQINAFRPDAVLIIKCTYIYLHNNSLNSIEFNLSLIDFESNKTFWRADISVSSFGLWPNGGVVAQRIYKTFTDQLENDNMMIFSKIEPL
ncbi:MAG: hypothetical protein JXB88_13680 [Spirochaetales bacterium]|nr:hypothetical protein [Spirochaetales bacterium]